MNTSPWIQIGLYLAVLFTIAWPLGRYLVYVFEGQLTQRFVWLDNFQHRFCRFIGANPEEDMPWWRYAAAVVLFNVIGVFSVNICICYRI